MKRTVFLFMTLFCCYALTAQEKTNTPWQTEHKGIDIKVKGGYSAGLGDAKGAKTLNFDASIGKRFDNMYFGLGLGAWIGADKSSGSDAIIPITADWEIFLTTGRITPTVLLRTGYGNNTAKDISFGKETIKMPNYLIAQIMPGIRLCISRAIDLDLAFGLTSLTPVGGSEGMNTNGSLLMSFGGALNFHKSTNSKPKKTRYTRDKGFQMTIEGGKINFGGEIYNGGDVSMIFGYKLNPHINLGLGFGFEWVDTYLENGITSIKTRDDGNVYGRDEDISTNFDTKKIFVRGLYRIINKRFSPFVSMDAGLRFYSMDYFYGEYAASDDYESTIEYVLGKPSNIVFFAAPAVGLSLRTTKNSYLELKAGYSVAPGIPEKSGVAEYDGSRFHFVHEASRKSLSMSAPFVTFGYTHTFGK